MANARTRGPVAETKKATPKKPTVKPAAKQAAAKKPTAEAAPKKAAPAKPAAKKPTAAPATGAKPHRVFGMSFASVYVLYVQKVEKKGRTKAELDEVLRWLTGYDDAGLARIIAEKTDFQTFFAEAPRLHPNARLITGVVCGVRVEEVADPLMQKIRWMDKLVDELAAGKKLSSILRA